MKCTGSLLAISAAVLSCFSPFVTAATTDEWKTRSIYFVLTDRIARGSDDNGGSACGNLGDYCGGTFKGLQGKLDYIKGLGFDAIWITPVIASELNETIVWSTLGLHRQ